MSYYLEVLKDCPQTLSMLSTGITDSSGHGNSLTVIGTPEFSSAPLVSNAQNAVRWRAGAYMATPFPYLEPGFERQSFAIETWIFPISATMPLASHLGDTDGLIWLSGTLYFILHFATVGYVGISYKPPTTRSMHAVGVYNGEKLELWVNGELVDSLSLTEAQKADKYYTQSLPNLLLAGNADGIQQGLATYWRTLSPTQIRNHYNAGRMTVGMNPSSGLFGGVREKINNETADIFLDRAYSTSADWNQGSGTAIIGDTISSPKDTTGAYVAGAWDTAIALDQGGTSIDHMTINWENTGVIVVYTSLDGITWSVPNNAGRVAGIAPGFNPTGKSLRVRVTFAAGSYGSMQSLDVHGYKTMAVTPATRPITLNAAVDLYEENQILDYNIASGFFGGGSPVTIGATSDSQPYQTVSLWYYAISGSLTVNATPTNFYENNVLQSVRTRVGEWVHALFVIPSQTTALSLTINGYIMAPTLYSDALTAAQVDTLYRSYTGIPVQAVDSATVIQVASPTVAIYANDWSITGAG